MNGLIVAVAGLIFFAIGIKLMIANLYEYRTIGQNLFLYGGPILYLLPQGWYLWYVTGKLSYQRLIGIIVLIITGLLTVEISPWIALLIVMLELSTISYVIIKFTNLKNRKENYNS